MSRLVDFTPSPPIANDHGQMTQFPLYKAIRETIIEEVSGSQSITATELYIMSSKLAVLSLN